MSEPIDACGTVPTIRIDEATVIRERVGPAHRGEHPVARVLERQVEVRRETAGAAAIRSTIFGVQSIGSSELIRNVTSTVAPSALSRPNSVEPWARSRPYDPRCTPVRTTP